MSKPIFSLYSIEDRSEYPLTRNFLLAGSGHSCNLKINSIKVPDECFLIYEKENTIYLRPLLPKNKIQLNEKALETEIELQENDQISIQKKLLFILRRSEIQTKEDPKEKPTFDFFKKLLIELPKILDTHAPSENLTELVKSIAYIFNAQGVALVYWSPSILLQIEAAYPKNFTSKNISLTCLRLCYDSQKSLSLKPLDLLENQSESISMNEISSVLCSPIIDPKKGFEPNQFIPLIYLDRTSDKEAFTESDEVLFQSIVELLSALINNLNIRRNQAKRIEILQRDKPSHIIFQSPNMVELYKSAARIAQADVNVFIEGETGSGKEVLARWIHTKSARSEKPFIGINCGAIAPNLLESELFGHEKGAFSGAHSKKVGWIEKAHEGTLFLDEIGDLDLNLQVKLLRVIQEGVVIPVGSTQEIRVDFRLICATHRDLEERVQEGNFRQDLLFRINVFHFYIPPLRARPDDIILFAKHFTFKYAEQFQCSIPAIGEKTKDYLRTQPWPGNVRELENKVQRALLICEGPTLLVEHFETNIQGKKSVVSQPDVYNLPLQLAREQTEKIVISNALKKVRGNVSKAADLLETDRKTLQRIIERIEIDVKEFK